MYTKWCYEEKKKKMENKILEKGAIPKILQEVYYKCKSDGSKTVNIELTLKRFKNKLKSIT